MIFPFDTITEIDVKAFRDFMDMFDLVDKYRNEHPRGGSMDLD